MRGVARGRCSRARREQPTGQPSVSRGKNGRRFFALSVRSAAGRVARCHFRPGQRQRERPDRHPHVFVLQAARIDRIPIRRRQRRIEQRIQPAAGAVVIERDRICATAAFQVEPELAVQAAGRALHVEHDRIARLPLEPEGHARHVLGDLAADGIAIDDLRAGLRRRRAPGTGRSGPTSRDQRRACRPPDPPLRDCTVPHSGHLIVPAFQPGSICCRTSIGPITRRARPASRQHHDRTFTPTPVLCYNPDARRSLG